MTPPRNFKLPLDRAARHIAEQVRDMPGRGRSNTLVVVAADDEDGRVDSASGAYAADVDMHTCEAMHQAAMRALFRSFYGQLALMAGATDDPDHEFWVISREPSCAERMEVSAMVLGLMTEAVESLHGDAVDRRRQARSDA